MKVNNDLEWMTERSMFKNSRHGNLLLMRADIVQGEGREAVRELSFRYIQALELRSFVQPFKEDGKNILLTSMLSFSSLN